MGSSAYPLFTMRVGINDANVRKLLAEAPEEFDKATQSGMDWTLVQMHRAVVENIEHPVTRPYIGTAIASGVLVGSVFSGHTIDPVTGGDEGVVDLLPPADIYGPAVEEGSRPHMPRVEPLIQWAVEKRFVGNIAEHRAGIRVNEKLLRAGFDKKSSGVLAKKLGRNFAAEGVAWAVAMKIKKFGTVGVHMFKRAFEAWETSGIARFREEYAAAVGRLNSRRG